MDSVFWDVWSGPLRAMPHKKCWGHQDGLSVTSKSLVRFLLKRCLSEMSCVRFAGTHIRLPVSKKLMLFDWGRRRGF